MIRALMFIFLSAWFGGICVIEVAKGLSETTMLDTIFHLVVGVIALAFSASFIMRITAKD